MANMLNYVFFVFTGNLWLIALWANLSNIEIDIER